MRTDRAKATKLRKEGWSYRKLSNELGIPLATLSHWFKDEKWSTQVKQKLESKSIASSTSRIIRLNKARGKNLDKLYKQARTDAKEEFAELKRHPLFVAGVMAYWGEGDKASRNGFRITNSDLGLMKIFINFLRQVTNKDEDRIRAWVLVYPDLDKDKCVEYWSKGLGLNKNNFTKSIAIQGRHKTKRVTHGICTISYSSRFLKEKMLIWISLLANELS